MNGPSIDPMPNTGTDKTRHECQICEGHFTAKKGLLAKHGYKRPGDGFLHGECFGAHRVDYATGTDALVEYRVLIADMHAGAVRAFEALAGLPAFNQTTLDYQRDKETGRIVYHGRRAQMIPVSESFAPGVSPLLQYNHALDYERMSRRSKVANLARELERIDARIAAFHSP